MTEAGMRALATFPPLRARDEIAWAICPSIREYSCGEGIDPACSRCPNTVMCSEGEGIQACRHAANVAADRVLALSSTAGQECETLPSHGALLAEINKAAHANGTNAWVRDVLQRAHRAIRKSAPPVAEPIVADKSEVKS